MILRNMIFWVWVMCAGVQVSLASSPAKNMADPYASASMSYAVSDTIPWEDRYGDFMTDKIYNPFDITPKEINQGVEFDPKTGQYIIYEKIGDEYYRTPTYMTYDEYMEYVGSDQEKKYFNTLAGIKSDKKSRSGKIDPMDKIELENSLIDRLFGGTEVNIKPQGSVDLSLGWLYSRRDDPNLPLRAQRQSQPDFPTPLIRMNVDGKIGKKLDLDFNYDTQSSFNFDRQMKMAFDSDAFSEDDIIKKIEAGNVSMPLRGNLIQGAQSLFGIKTELQFGRLRLTGLVSQQRSRANNIRLENGQQEQEFIITPNKYDENRHFFISHYNRETYEENLSNLPYIGTSFQIAQIEVWVSDDRPEFQDNSTMVAAIADLGEPGTENFTSDPSFTRVNCNAVDNDNMDNPRCLPRNEANDVYEKLTRTRGINDIDRVARELESPTIGLVRTRDFEVFRGRRLSPSEFTYHPQLGTISLNMRLRPNQVLGVAYNYFFTSNCDTVYQVGQISLNATQPARQTDTTRVEPPKVHFVKLLKSTNQITTSPMWDLMMKNVYNLGVGQLSADDFEFDIFFEDDLTDGSFKKFIPDPTLNRVPLLQLFNLDNLNRFGDPQPDGFFDYIPGVTVIERSGSVVLPVLEPFGSHLSVDNILRYDPASQVTDAILEPFRYQNLYDTIVQVTEHADLARNKFRMMGRVKSGSNNGEIYLGPFVPQGSVRVSAGGRDLIEGQDYEIDYSLGRLRVLNPAFLGQGTPIDVRFEDNSLFSLQQKNMMGLRGEYLFRNKSTLGATILRLQERPFTQKVNYGDDPIRNTMYGLDYNAEMESKWLSKMISKLPFYSTDQPSKINVIAEAAGIQPGHARAIDFEYINNDGELVRERSGTASLDDFEGAITILNLGGFNSNLWSLASTPPEIPGAKLNTLEYNANRALLNWSGLDLGTRRSQADATHPYTRIVNQNELFTNRQVIPGQQQLFTFDISYYPGERGPYNFDKRQGYPGISAGFTTPNNKIVLNDPASRWAGIQRYFQNSDFEAANFENIEFWVLNPYMDRPDGISHAANEEGEIVFNLGSVSEDVMKDDLLFFENALPTSQRRVPVTNTDFGKATVSIPMVNGFDIQEAELQDLGFDGMNDDEERGKYDLWLIENNLAGIPEIVSDPSNDNFIFFDDPQLSGLPSLLDRMKFFNGPQGNAPLQNSERSNQGNALDFIRGNRYPDTEDINNNKALDLTEAYYEYRIKIKRNGNELDTTDLRYYRQTVEIEKNGFTEKWYRFQIPIREGNPIGDIAGFRGIQFMRMYFTNFESAKTFRFADFQLQRSIWRKQPVICSSDAGNPQDQADEFSLDDVGIEENSGKQPFNYFTPRGAIRTQAFTTFANLLQDERSMALRFNRLAVGCEVGMSKLADVNLALYKRVQMFVHAEDALSTIGTQDSLKNGDVSLVLRLGKDFPTNGSRAVQQMENNYYEYEIPLRPSDLDVQTTENIWRSENFVDIPIDSFLALRRNRIANNIRPRDGIMARELNPGRGDTIRMVGNPSLGAVKVIQISVRNRRLDREISGEVWVNELRMVGYNEDMAFAAEGKVQIQLSDLGEINVAGGYQSNGFGAIDQRLHQRSREEILRYDASINIDAGKLLPPALKLSAPVYAQYQKEFVTPQFDPIDQDIKVRDKLRLIDDPVVRDSIREVAREEITIKTFNVTNLRVNAGKPGLPWSPSNFGFTYAYSETNRSDFLLKEDKLENQIIGFDYAFTNKLKPVEPFKFIKTKALRLISDFNFSPLPNNFAFSSRMTDVNGRRLFRLPTEMAYGFDEKRFTWNRDYVLDWDLAKSIRIGFRANASSIVDQLYQSGIAETLEDRLWFDQFGNNRTQDVLNNIDEPRDYFWNNFNRLGRSKTYQHQLNANYKLPFRSIPILDWIDAAVDYRAQYGFDAGSLISIDPNPRPDGTLLGNTIRNNQNASLNVTLNFSKLYGKSSYLKSIETGRAPRKKASSPAERRRGLPSAGSKGDAMMALPEGDEEQNKKESRASRKDQPKPPSMTERALLRPLMLVRSIKVNYREENSTLIPGFMPQSSLMGMSEGFQAPGWAFVAGIQPRLTGENNWLLTNQEWFNASTRFNDRTTQTRRQTFDSKFLIEPFKDFSIDVSFRRNFQETSTQVFRKTSKTGEEFQQLALFDVGSFDASFFALNTLFKDPAMLYERFKSNRNIIARRLDNVESPGLHPRDPSFPGGYGPTHNSVIVPAFMATYTQTSPFTVALDQREVFSNRFYIPAPNWQLNYNGLAKLKYFKDIFTNVTIKHGYQSNIRVNSFQTQPLFNENEPFRDLSPNDNYYSRFELDAITIQEQFVPVIGISIKTVKDMKIDLDYKSTRTLALGPTQLRENIGKELSIGGGYVLRMKKAPKKKKKGKRKVDGAPEDEDNTSLGSRLLRGNKSATSDVREVRINFTYSMRDDVSQIYDLLTEIDAQADRGQRTIVFKPFVEYDVNTNLTMRFYFDYSRTVPKTTLSFPTTLIRSGVTLRFNIN